MQTTALDELERLHLAASPGPWYVRELNDEVCMSAVAVSTMPASEDYSDFYGEWPAKELVAACLLQSPPLILPDGGRSHENAALIAAMRTSLPELLRLARANAEAQAQDS